MSRETVLAEENADLRARLAQAEEREQAALAQAAAMGAALLEALAREAALREVLETLATWEKRQNILLPFDRIGLRSKLAAALSTVPDAPLVAIRRMAEVFIDGADLLHGYHLGSSPRSDWRECGLESWRIRQAALAALEAAGFTAGHTTDLEPLDDEPDPDRAHDEAVERRLFGEESDD